MLIAYLLLCMLLPAASGFAREHRCENQPEVLVSTANPEMVEDICLAASQTIDFLAQYNLPPKRTISFKVIEEKIDSHGYIAYGSYDIRTDIIQLMSFSAILAGASEPKMYGEPFDRVHYLGAIAHEVTHAIFQHHVQAEQISTAPQEYLACSAQLAVLPGERRAQIIRAQDVAPWESGDTISDAYLAMQPGKFAVKSYLHLTSLKDPSSFIDILLKAKWFYVYVP